MYYGKSVSSIGSPCTENDQITTNDNDHYDHDLTLLWFSYVIIFPEHFFQHISEDINYDISVDTLDQHGFKEYFSAKPTDRAINNGMQPPHDAREIFMGCGLYRWGGQ